MSHEPEPLDSTMRFMELRFHEGTPEELKKLLLENNIEF